MKTGISPEPTFPTAFLVATTQTNAFDRVFPSRELLRGTARGALVWGSLSAILLCFLLFDLFLAADLLATRGSILLTADQLEEYERLSGYRLPVGEGILPTVWRTRDKPWGPTVAQLYLRIAALRDNSYALMLLILAAVGIGFIRSLLLARARRVSRQTSTDSITRLRRTLHRQTLRLGPGALDESEPEQVLNLFTAEADRVRDGIAAWVYRIGRYPFELALLLLVTIAIHWWLAFQCLIPMAFCWYLVKREGQRFAAARQLAQARTEAELRLLAESFRKTRIVRGYGMEEFEHSQFQKHLDRFRNNAIRVERGESWSRWLSWTLVTVCAAIVMFLIGIKVLQTPDQFSFAAAITMTVTFLCLHGPLEGLWNLGEERHQASVAADRIFRYLNRIPDVSQAVGAKFLQPVSKSVQFESVRYHLPDKNVLIDGLDLKIQSGECVAFVSMNPLEARALAYLLPRFIEPQAGRVLFDGEDIAWTTLESLRAETIFVGGSDPFFTGTVSENISCGNPRFSLQDITEAAKTVHAHSFILRLPQGYETVLGEHGEQLDDGQSFRLGLARAVLRDPAVLIVGEPGAQLDDDTKSLLDDAYGRVLPGRTVVFLPSRLSTLRRADRVVLLHRGKIDAAAPYSTLVKKSALYRHWEYVRFNQFRRELEPAAP